LNKFERENEEELVLITVPYLYIAGGQFDAEYDDISVRWRVR
jgi:hypothetical protein